MLFLGRLGLSGLDWTRPYIFETWLIPVVLWFRSNLFSSSAKGCLSLFEKDSLKMTADEHFSLLFGIDWN